MGIKGIICVTFTVSYTISPWSSPCINVQTASFVVKETLNYKRKLGNSKIKSLHQAQMENRKKEENLPLKLNAH